MQDFPSELRALPFSQTQATVRAKLTFLDVGRHNDCGGHCLAAQRELALLAKSEITTEIVNAYTFVSTF